MADSQNSSVERLLSSISTDPLFNLPQHSPLFQFGTSVSMNTKFASLLSDFIKAYWSDEPDDETGEMDHMCILALGEQLETYTRNVIAYRNREPRRQQRRIKQFTDRHDNGLEG